MDVETRLRRLSAYASPFAASNPIEPPPAHPADFIGVELAPPLARLFQTRGLQISPEQINAALDRDRAPIPAPLNRENYAGSNHFAYWLSGFIDYLQLTRIAAMHGIEGGSVFDFGGSTGRVFRNFYYQGEWEVWANDFKRASVEWNIANFPPAIKIFQGMYFPSLPLEDRSIDLTIAMSVFTHIDETETNWLMELRRILRPGGLALFTIHNEATWENMGPTLRHMIEKHSPEFAACQAFPSDRFVSNFRDDDPYRCNTFHSDGYIHRQWSRYFEVIDILARMSGDQAIVVLRRPA